MTQRIAVIGGGVMGITAALRLAQRGHAVTLYEAAEQLGGLADAWSLQDGLTWDRHYHVTLLSDSYTRGLFREVNLDDAVRWVNTRTGFFDGQTLAPLTTSIDYLRLPSLRMIDKVRIAMTIRRAAALHDSLPLEQQTVEHWLRRQSGDHAFETLWRPLLRAKLGEQYHETSAAFIWATIQRLYAARRSGLKRDMFGYVPGGYAEVLCALTQKLRTLGVTLRMGKPVDVITDHAPLHSVTHGGSTDVFDQIVVTTTPRVAAQLCGALRQNELEKLRAVRYQGIVCASVVLDRPLSPYYLTYLTDQSLPFTAVVDMTAFINADQLGGRGLVYLPRYVPGSDPLFIQDDDTIRASFLCGLRRVYPSFDEHKVQAFKVSRVKEVFPVPTLHYSRSVLPHRTSVPGLWLVNASQIVNGTLNVNDSVRVAEDAIDAIHAEATR